ncbi:MAG: hypothetical protein PVF68_04330 [Acidobacteriota bacterium]|jgi:hypothetical protein
MQALLAALAALALVTYRRRIRRRAAAAEPLPDNVVPFPLDRSVPVTAAPESSRPVVLPFRARNPG